MKRLELSFWTLIVWYLYFSNFTPCIAQDESIGAPMQRGEQLALYYTIQDFVGKWWNGSDLYPDPCGWTPIQGISCDLYNGFWYVTDLSIGPVHDNSLTCAQNVEYFSPHLFSLRHLKSLTFFNCFVSPRRRAAAIPADKWEAFAGSLESLEFRSNSGLTGTIPVSFGELRNLQSLVITENGLFGQLPESLGNLLELRRLNLAGNSFTGSIPGSFGGLNRLLILDMSGNSLSGALPVTLGGLTVLLKLDLSGNKLEGKIPVEIQNLKNLTLLDLSNNRLSGGLESIQELGSLQELVLSNNPIGGDLMSVGWQNLRCITALDLSNTSLTGGIPESIAYLKSMRFLGLNDNKLTGEIPSKIATLSDVGAIYVHGNNLSGELNFSEVFYRRMGRRFGASGNPNLCYRVEFESSSCAPFGVKECRIEVIKYETDLDLRANSNSEVLNSDPSIASLGFKEFGVSELLLLVEVFFVLIFNYC